MSLEVAPRLPESDVTSMSFEDTELTLGLPGEGRSSAVITAVKFSSKRGFIETVDLNLGSCSTMPRGCPDTRVNKSGAGKPPAAKMFIECCNRIRLMKSSEAAVLALAPKASTPK